MAGPPPQECPNHTNNYYVTNTSTSYVTTRLRHALNQIDYETLRPLQGTRQDGKYHGIGLGCFVKNTGQGPFEGARVVVNSSENIAVYLGISSLGQGHQTTMAQICADTLGVPPEAFTIFHGNTDMMPFGVGTFASRGTVMAGNAVHLACQKLRDKALAIASHYLELDVSQLVYQRGRVHRQGAEDRPLLGLDDLVRLAGPVSPYNLNRST